MKIIAVTSYKFDKDYLEDWKRNLRTLVDDYLIIYDKEGDFFKDEGKYRQLQYKLAKEKGGEWVVVLDPDERFEKGAAKKIKDIIKRYGNNADRLVLKFNFRELYEPKKYRVDGVWGKKVRFAVFRLKNDNIYSDKQLHTPKEPQNSDVKIIETDLNIYHLKHIKPELRKNRKDIYNKLDPQHKFQGIGYDYLDDETDMKLKGIAIGRGYCPKYRDYEIDERIFKI